MRTRNKYCFQIFELHRNLEAWFLNITPASPATVSGAYFAALCKMRDAYGSPRASNCYVLISIFNFLPPEISNLFF